MELVDSLGGGERRETPVLRVRLGSVDQLDKRGRRVIQEQRAGGASMREEGNKRTRLQEARNPFCIT